MSLVSRRLTAALLALSLAFALTLVTASSSHAAGTGTVSGTVKDESNAPLAGIFVQAYDYSAGANTLVALGTPAETDATGAYTLTDVPEGTHVLKFSDLVQLKYATEWYGDAAFAGSGTTVAVAAGTETSGINETLGVGGEIRGQVVDVHGDGIGDITVQPYRQNGSSWEPTDSTLTYDASSVGTYRLPALLPGKYKLAFVDDNHRGYVNNWSDDEPTLDYADYITVFGNPTPIYKNATLSKLNSIYGRVLDASSGFGINNAVVDLVDPTTHQVLDNVVTNAVGTYVLHEVPFGTFAVTAHSPTGGYVEGSATSTITFPDNFEAHDVYGINVTLQPSTPPPAPEVATTAVGITGTAVVGKTLQAVPATWTRVPSTITYEWSVGGVPVQNVFGSSFTVPASAVGKHVSVTEIADAEGQSSAQTGAVAAGTITCSHLAVTFTGGDKMPNVGNKAKAAATCSAAKVAVQWVLGTKPVAGKIGKGLTLALTKPMQGKVLKVRVTVTRSGYKTVVKTLSFGKVAKKKKGH